MHSTTGETPFYLMFGRDPTISIDLILNPKRKSFFELTENAEYKAFLTNNINRAWKIAQETAIKQVKIMETQCNKSRKDNTIRVGDLVLLKRDQVKVGEAVKFRLPWKGIFRVVSIDIPHAIIHSCVDEKHQNKQVHLNQIKNFYGLLGNMCTTEKEKDTIIEKRKNHNYNLRK